MPLGARSPLNYALETRRPNPLGGLKIMRHITTALQLIIVFCSHAASGEQATCTFAKQGLQTLLSSSNIAYACRLNIKIFIIVMPRSGFTDFSCTVDVDVVVQKVTFDERSTVTVTL